MIQGSIRKTRVGLVILVLAAFACPGPSKGPQNGEPSAAAIEKGRAIYVELRCSKCHSLAGKGGVMGPPVDRVGAKRRRDWLHQYLLDPASKVEDAKMPAVEMTPEELELLVAYLRSLK